MSPTAGPVYEVTLSIDREIIDSFDEWLAHHVDEMLALPGFEKANVFALDDDEHDRAVRVTHYYLASDHDLDEYLAGPATEMRQSGIDRFGDRFSTTRRILRDTDIAEGELHRTENCLNCDAPLTGQYCGNCGQRAQSRLISLWELTRDAFGDLFELDSRIWRTLIPLLVRPGKLTREYLEGRRARFMPPFRTYLVLSILFFVVLLFDPKEEFGILFEPEAESPEEAASDEPTADEVRDEIIKELADEGIITMPPPADTSSEVDDVEPDEAPEEDDTWSGAKLEINTDGDGTDCEVDSMDDVNLPDWLKRRITRERLQIVCERVTADNGKALLTKLQNNVPAALFFLLPLMAFVLKLLYPLSKRYYVEHLLFVVHYHAFFFLILILQMLISRAAVFLAIPEIPVEIILVVASLYIPVYLYKAIRKVYGQGHLATIPKYVFLVFAYFVGLFLVLGVTALFAAFAL